MSTYYGVLANFYDEFYPVDPKLGERLATFFGEPPKKLLVIGCATGAVCKQLYDMDYGVVCMDKEKKMLEKTLEREPNLETIHLDMRRIGEIEGGYSGVLALADILSHVENAKELRSILQAIYDMLIPFGGLVIELHNYEMILRQKLDKLPNIILRGGKMGLQRTFCTDSHKHRLKKNVIRVDDLIIESKQHIYPAGKDEIEKMLKDIGFSVVETYANFMEETFNPRRSQRLVIAARK